ncbi:hypothetical protein EDC14_1003238 [Hydrogenispora ethanolica]|uniref:Uncharacterized protein n=1 Tax=Hydrogenispora ethanolica TaxID=1082276 RepID=A0A4R1S850_HYDET|nr:hypothetical protein [Hydrogenispora ethanolica]TCL75304.1 hypothetical protein EDC14_1003238 [Hydrogenispora ethanolica]
MSLYNNLLFWPGLAIGFAIPTIILIPRQEYKKFFIFGFILGGLVDVLSILVFGNLLGEFSYLAGPFMTMGIPIFVPVAFTFVWMLFLYFLPVRLEFLIPYIMGFAGFSVFIGAVEQNLGYFQYHRGLVRGSLTTLVVFLVWFSLSAWVYRHYLPKLDKSH